MKIKYIANIRIPTEKAHGIQIMKTCEAFAALGAVVELIVPSRINLEIKEKDAFVYYYVKRKFAIRKLFSLDPLWLWKLPGGIYIKIQSFFFVSSLFLYFLFRPVPRQTVLYTRDEYLLPLLLKFSKNVVWEAHNLPRNKERYLKYWTKCQKIVAISKGIQRQLNEVGILEKKILVAPDGYDPNMFGALHGDLFNVRKDLNLPQDKKIVLYAGQLYKWKGAETLLNAAKYLDDLHFVFVGGVSPDVDQFREMAKQYKNVDVRGQEPYVRIPFYFTAADILVLPNSGKAEISKIFTSPLKLFEYMASGKPIVASDLPSIREILDEDSAVFFSPDDANDLSEKIRMILSGQVFGEKLAKQASENVLKYSWHERAKKILGEIEKINENR